MLAISMLIVGIALISAIPASRADANSPSAAEAQQLLALVNDYRAQYNLKPLTISAPLQAAAEWMAQDMAENDSVNHMDSRGRRTAARLADFGYVHNAWMGENLASGARTPEASWPFGRAR